MAPEQAAHDTVKVERRGHLLIVTINRPEMKNAVNPETSDLIQSAMDVLDETDELFVGIITGAGGNFSAGADLKAAAERAKAGKPNPTRRRGGFGVFKRPPRKPLIAAIEGYALGGGFELALSCDLVVAAESAKFGLPEVRHNVIATGGGLFRLPRKIPTNIAMEMALDGKPRPAAFLEKWGFVNRLVAEGRALDEAIALAESLLINGPTALASTKEIIFQSASWATEDQAWEEQKPIAQTAIDSEDRREGMTAFLEKRKPVWKGR